MPTPSDTPSLRWEARPTGPKRSVFGNYRTTGTTGIKPDATPAAGHPSRQPAVGREESGEGREVHVPDSDASVFATRDSICARSSQEPPSLDTAIARAYIYQFIARAFEDPEPETWRWLARPDTGSALWRAVRSLGDPVLEKSALAFLRGVTSESFEVFLDSYVSAFGHASRGNVPMNEIEYGDLKADPLFQPHRLADLAAFYRAFGLEIDEAATERQDHLCLELEFMSVLAAKEAYALKSPVSEDGLQIVQEGQRQFLREHLGRWSPAFSRRLRSAAAGEVMSRLADLLVAFIESECARARVRAGSVDLLLRPVDDAAERLCESCGTHLLTPGALPAGS